MKSVVPFTQQTRSPQLVWPSLRSLRRAILSKGWYIHLLLWITVLFVGFPVFYAILASTQTNAQMFSLLLKPGESFAFNLDAVLERGIGRLIMNTLIVSSMVTVGKTILSMFSGIALVYFQFPGKYIFFGLILGGLMVPGEVTVIALYRLVAIELGWGNSWTALVVPFLASTTGTFLFRQQFAGMPAELSEAAQLDGTNPIQFLFRVLIPLSWNTVGVLVAILFIGTWNSYLWPLLIITDADLQVIQAGLRSLVQGVEVGRTLGPIMLGAVIASIPPVVVFILLQKQFLEHFGIANTKPSAGRVSM